MLFGHMAFACAMKVSWLQQKQRQLRNQPKPLLIVFLRPLATVAAKAAKRRAKLEG